MRSWIIPVLAALGLLSAALFCTPIQGIVYDPKPAPEAMADTVVLNRPLPPLPAPPAKAAANAPLDRQLVIRERVPVKVQHGEVALPPGMPVELSSDQGETVEIQFGERRQSTRVIVPRSAVANPSLPEPLEPAGPIDTVKKTVTDLGRAPASSIAIEAKEVGTGRGVARSFDSIVGSNERDYFRSKGLTVTVRNLSRRPTGDFEITVYWTGRRLADNQLHITHGETFHTNVAGVSEHQETSWCPLLDSQITTYDWNNSKRSSGSKFDGWFVVVTRDQQMLVGRGATEKYNQIIRNTAQLQPLLATWTGSSLHATENRPLWRHERPGKTASPHDTAAGGTTY